MNTTLRAVALASLLLATTALLAEPTPEKATLAWKLPWDADWVTAVSFVGPSRVAAGNNPGQILVWDLPDDQKAPAPAPARLLVGHTNVVNRLVATPDGRWLISASNDHTIRYWDLRADAKGTETVELNARARREATDRKRKVPAAVEAKVRTQSADRVLEGHRDWVLGLSLSRDGNVLASGDDRGEIVLWDRPAGKEIRRWKTKGWVWALALSPDAKTVAASERVHLVFDQGRHTGLKIWDAAKEEVRHDLAKALGKEQMTAAAAFSPDGKLVAVGRGGEVDGLNGKVTLFDPATGKKHRELTPGHLNGLTDLAFSPDGKFLYSSGRDTVVRAWNVADGKLVKELGQPRGGQFKDWICAVAVSPDGKRHACAYMAGKVHVWSLDGK
jgi:WD40 repeat protein